jgi:hypothetical protein
MAAASCAAERRVNRTPRRANLWAPKTGLMDAALKRVKNGKLYLIPASDQTQGHLTAVIAKFYSQQLEELLKTAPRRAITEKTRF